jgi:N-acyl-D-amino-acid deacylase
VLCEGAFADITVFDADRVADRATWDAPTLRAEGIDTVIVNGQPTWQDGRSLGVRGGRVVRLTDAARGR